MTPDELPSSDDALARLAREAAALPDAPPRLVRAAIDAWAGAPWRRSAEGGVLKRIVAALGFDSWAPAPLALGVRGLKSPTRHLLFTAEGRDVDLRIAPAGALFALAGQVLGPDGAGVVCLARDGEAGAPREAALDAMGEFRLEGLAAGRYALTLRAGDAEIVLPPIEVGPPT